MGMQSGVRWWLRVEGVVALLGGAAAWIGLGGPWPLFAILLISPDVSMVGYLANPRIGALMYNAVHNWAVGGAAVGLGLALALPVLTLAGVILVAHTGLDRALGYGLKESTGFRDTHLGRIGRAP
jgi:hypothetical protein